MKSLGNGPLKTKAWQGLPTTSSKVYISICDTKEVGLQNFVKQSHSRAILSDLCIFYLHLAFSSYHVSN